MISAKEAAEKSTLKVLESTEAVYIMAAINCAIAEGKFYIDYNPIGMKLLSGELKRVIKDKGFEIKFHADNSYTISW
jgi:hypothetical protein